MQVDIEITRNFFREMSDLLILREKGLVKWNCGEDHLRAISMVKAPPHDDVKSSILGNK